MHLSPWQSVRARGLGPQNPCLATTGEFILQPFPGELPPTHTAAPRPASLRAQGIHLDTLRLQLSLVFARFGVLV